MTLILLTTLLGSTVAVKVYALIKILGINIENYTEEDFLKLLEKPEFRKYYR